MRGSSIAFVVMLAFCCALAGCSEEKHPEAESLAALINEEIKAYKSAQNDCENAEIKLDAFYENPQRHERVAKTAIAIISKYFDKGEDYCKASAKLIKPCFNKLGSAIFDFNSRCQLGSDALDVMRLTSGQKIKQAMNGQDAGAVSRMYQMEGDLREFIQSGFYVYDPEVEIRLANLQQHRARKEARSKLSGGLKLMDRLINTADRLVPAGNEQARSRMNMSKKAWELQKSLIKSISNRRR